MFIKTYRYLFLVLITGLMVSCDRDEEPGISPSIALVNEPGFIANETKVIPGSSMAFKVEMVEGSEKLTNFYIEVRAGGQPPKRYFDTALYAAKFIWTGSFYKSPVPEETWSFIVRDRLGGESLVDVVLLADTGSLYGPVLSLGGIAMGAQENSQLGGCYSFVSEAVYFLGEAKENQEIIDMVFYYGEDGLTMASPGANIEDGVFPGNTSPVNWETRNTTRYIKTSLTNEDFDQVKSDSAMIALYIDAEGKRKAKNLAAGDVYVFRNQAARLGLFRVNAADGTTAGTANIDVKIQPGSK